MENKTVIGTSTDMTWAQLSAIEDLNMASEFITDRQKACLLLAQESGSSLIQLLITDGYTNELTDSEGFHLTQFAEWLDNHFSKTDTDILMKCAFISSLHNKGIDPFENMEE